MTDMAALLEQLQPIDGIERIKFVTNYPKDMTERLLIAVRDLPKVSPYLHVPAQSGSDAVLKRIRKGTCRAQQIVTKYDEEVGVQATPRTFRHQGPASGGSIRPLERQLQRENHDQKRPKCVDCLLLVGSRHGFCLRGGAWQGSERNHRKNLMEWHGHSIQRPPYF